MRIYVPPGIGDISWIYSKVGHLPDLEFVVSDDGSPRRSEAFIDLLPNVRFGGYEIVPPTVPIVALDDVPRDGEYAICNPFLESGIPLGRVWPSLPTNYYYPICGSEEDVAMAESVITQPTIGIYCSSYKHRGGGLWSVDQWVEFMRAVDPGARWVVLGADYDDKSHEVAAASGAINLVGRAGLGATIEVIRRLDYFFAFPSGLGILADVVRTPCTMWYWGGNHFCANGRATYSDPALSTHIVRIYNTVDREVIAARTSLSACSPAR